MTDRPLSQDDRQDLAGAALLAERRNRPRHLVIFGLFALIASVIAVVWGLSVHSGAQDEAARERGYVFRLKQLGADFESLSGQKQQPVSGPPWEPVSNMQTRLEGLATSTGLAKPSLPREQRNKVQTGVESLRLTYRIRSEDPRLVFSWIRQALGEIEGLELYSLRVQPEATTWSFDITFSRWERSGT